MNRRDLTLKLRRRFRRDPAPAGRRVFSPFAIAAVVLGLLSGCQLRPVVLPAAQQRVIDRKITEYPSYTQLKPYVVNLNSPTGFCIDEAGNMIIAEGGIHCDPRIIGIRPDGTQFVIYPVGTRIPIFKPGFRIYGPVGGIAELHGRVFVSHRDSDGYGVITSFGYDGSHTTVVADLPAQGDYSVTDIAVSPLNGGRLYFGVGSVTNSGVVGLDNWVEGWVRKHPNACDQPYHALQLLGYRFDVQNPEASIFTPPITDTVPFRPFGISNVTSVPAAPNGKPSGAIFSISPGGGDLQVVAWGVRDPVGIAVNKDFDTVYFTDRGMELRGTRPIWGDPDGLFHLVPDAWYGWPDFSRSLEPIDQPKYQPPTWMVIDSGYPDVGFVIDHQASGLADPDRRWLRAEFKPLSGAAKMDIVPSNGPFRAFAGNLLVALWGNAAPFATSGFPLLKPWPGFRIVRVDPDARIVKQFVYNTMGGPASSLKEGRHLGLERPIDVKFAPDGSVYILDFGRMRMKHGRMQVERGTGKIFHLVAAPVEPQTAPSH